MSIKIVAFSDTHMHHRNLILPEGDVLVFAGDMLTCGYKFQEVKDFADWFSEQPHQYKIVVAGNHDRVFESSRAICTRYFAQSVMYLEDTGVAIEGFNFYGSPWTPEFNGWAFGLTDEQLERKWRGIPDVDVLITHGPPYGILDKLTPYGHLGDKELAKKVVSTKPMLHIFGHIHGSTGIGMDVFDDLKSPMSSYYHLRAGTVYHNVSICDESYKPVNEPRVIEIEK
jgi:Icc-related predicted phosphoesterase